MANDRNYGTNLLFKTSETTTVNELGKDTNNNIVTNGDTTNLKIPFVAGTVYFTPDGYIVYDHYVNNAEARTIMSATAAKVDHDFNATLNGSITTYNGSEDKTITWYAPTTSGTKNQILVSNGGSSAPTWLSTAAGAAYASSTNGALTFGTLGIEYGGTNATNTTDAVKNLGLAGIYPVIGTQTSKTGAWTGQLHNVSALYDGLTIAYFLPYAGDGNATLNLTLDNGTTTGAINCYYTNATRLTTHYGAGSVIILTYYKAGSISVSGTATTDNRWLHSDYDSTNIYQLRKNYSKWTANSTIYRYQLLFQVNETKLTPMNNVNNNTGTSKTLLTSVDFLPFGEIYYYNSTTTVTANNAIGTSTLYTQILADLRYSFNTGSTLTAGSSVFMKTSPQSNGKVRFNSIVQSLPTTEDGFVYIYLGQAYDTYRVELCPFRVVYQFFDGRLQNIIKGPDKTITLSGDISGTSTYANNTWSITTTLKNSGITAGAYGQTTSVTNTNFSIPHITFDAQGRATAAENITVTIKDMTGASSSAAGTHGLVPAPGSGKNTAFLRGDGSWVIPTNTTYSNGTGLALNGTIFSIADTGVTAGSYGPSAGSTLSSGGTFTVPFITVNAQGQLTSASTITYTLPSHSNHTLTFGDGTYVYDGSADVTVPVYTGTYTIT